MEKKIQYAINYVANIGRKASEEEHMYIRNDAANIFADNYEEYMVIYEALKNHFVKGVLYG